MTRHGQIDLDAAIPRYRFVPEAREDRATYMARVAAATAFAYTMAPAQFEQQEGFRYEVDSVTLPMGVIARGKVRGRVRLVRDRALVASTGAESLFVYLIVAGSAVRMEHGAKLGPGDIFVHDLAEPAEIVLDGYEVLMLIVGRGGLPEELRGRSLDGAVVPHHHPLAALVSGMFAALHDAAGRLRPVHAAAAFDAAIMLLGGALGDVTLPDRASVPIKARAEAVIEAALAQPDLTPAVVARRLGVSRATLYRAFQPYGGVRRLISTHRLHRAWALCSARPAPSAKALAQACGYASTAKLDRALREAFGMSAREIAALPDDHHHLLADGAAAMLADQRRLIAGD